MGTGSLIEPILVALGALLKPRGYVKSGSTFRLRNSNTVSIIALQSSTSSTSSLARVTVNLAVHVPALEDSQRRKRHPSVWSAHWRQRIGHLMPEKNDTWWVVHSANEGRQVAEEIARCVEQFGLPAVTQLSTLAALQQLWQSGRGPGLTEGQRVRYLQQLAEAATS
jgi:hypothetical protein